MAISKQGVVDLYRKRAENYDLSAALFYLAGFNYNRYRRQAVDALELGPGHTVVEIACGTGLNFPLIQKRVGPEGRIIGVDITDRMLEQAKRRVEENGWKNVELLNRDAAEYSFPSEIQGILSTFGITLVPEYDRVIANGCGALAPDGRFSILDLKEPENRPRWMTQLLVWLTKPFGVSLDLAERHPWESLARYCLSMEMKELYMGYAYIAVGKHPLPSDASSKLPRAAGT